MGHILKVRPPGQPLHPRPQVLPHRGHQQLLQLRVDLQLNVKVTPQLILLLLQAGHVLVGITAVLEGGFFFNIFLTH